MTHHVAHDTDLQPKAVSDRLSQHCMRTVHLCQMLRTRAQQNKQRTDIGYKALL
jgi:hypothetical protein